MPNAAPESPREHLDQPAFEFSPELVAKANESLPDAQDYFRAKANKVESVDTEGMPAGNQERMPVLTNTFERMKDLALEVKTR